MVVVVVVVVMVVVVLVIVIISVTMLMLLMVMDHDMVQFSHRSAEQYCRANITRQHCRRGCLRKKVIGTGQG